MKINTEGCDSDMSINTEGRADLDYIVREVWEGGCYKFDEIAKIVCPKVAIDIGASCGPATIQMLSTWSDCIVHSYEPDPTRFALLKENTEPFGDRLHLSMTAVCGSNRQHVGFDGMYKTSAEAVWEYMRAFGSVEFPAASLPDAELMKIDCEGFEWAILEDLAVAGRLPHVIVGEWHFQNCKDALVEILSKTHDVTHQSSGCLWEQFLAVKKP
jgi:FkbM family methyltransferase